MNYLIQLCCPVFRCLLSYGADRKKKTEDGETALELVEEDDYKTVAALQDTKEEAEKERRESIVKKREPAWVRRESVQEAVRERRESLQEVTGEKDSRRKGSAWVGKEEILEEEEIEVEEETTELAKEVIEKDIKVTIKRQRRQGRLELPSLGEESFVNLNDRIR